MPEFVMEGINESAREETPFVHGFIQVLFFTNSSMFPTSKFFSKSAQRAIREGTADGCLPNDVGYADIHPDSLKEIRDFCEYFQKRAAVELQAAYDLGYDETQAGMDFHYDHVGAGVGFRDRDAFNGHEDLAIKLSELAGSGEINPFFGDHVTYGNAPFVHVDMY